MVNQQPIVTTLDGRRRFACSPLAVLVFIVNEAEQILLLAHPQRKGWWEVVNGALEAEETLLAGALRETREEVGAAVRVRPLGTIHASTFSYDANVPYMISLSYLMAYEGGPVQPGDDMLGSEYRWWTLTELAAEDVKIVIPPHQKWLMKRAIECYRLWKEQTVDLQLDLGLTILNKYTL